MAKKGELNKSEAIRIYVGKNPKASAKEVQKALKAEQGIDVSIQMIYTTKSNAKRGKTGKTGRRGRPRKTTTAATVATVAAAPKAKKPGRPAKAAASGTSAMELLDTKKLVDQLGGVAETRKALDVLEQLLED
ncbi:MAG: hypothetical protein AAFP90_11700 [Planctomycetota bacterium]